jgi:hypothetical protein
LFGCPVSGALRAPISARVTSARARSSQSRPQNCSDDARQSLIQPRCWQEYDAHHSMKKFVVDTHAWALLADALAVVPPASSHNPPASPRAIEPASGDSSARSSSPSSSDVELVVRPHYKLVARGEPEPDLRRSASPPARDVGMRRTDGRRHLFSPMSLSAGS